MSMQPFPHLLGLSGEQLLDVLADPFFIPFINRFSQQTFDLSLLLGGEILGFTQQDFKSGSYRRVSCCHQGQGIHIVLLS